MKSDFEVWWENYGKHQINNIFDDWSWDNDFNINLIQKTN